MAVRRVAIGDNGSGSPFVVSVDGYDAIGANFQRLLFDADQTPFRLMTTGLITGVSPPATGAGINDKQGSVQYTFPGGRYPVVLVAGRNEAYEGNGGSVAAGDITPPYIKISNYKPNSFNYRQNGYGLLVQNDGRLFGLNANEVFSISTPTGAKSVPTPPVTIYYAIMQNMG